MCNRARLSHEPGSLFGAKGWRTEKPRDNRFNPVEPYPKARAYVIHEQDRVRGIDVMGWDVLNGGAKSRMTNVRNLAPQLPTAGEETQESLPGAPDRVLRMDTQHALGRRRGAHQGRDVVSGHRPGTRWKPIKLEAAMPPPAQTLSLPANASDRASRHGPSLSRSMRIRLRTSYQGSDRHPASRPRTSL